MGRIRPWALKSAWRLVLVALLAAGFGIGWAVGDGTGDKVDFAYMGVGTAVAIYSLRFADVRSFLVRSSVLYAATLPPMYLLVVVTLLPGQVAGGGGHWGAFLGAAAVGTLLGALASLAWSMKYAVNAMSKRGAGKEIDDPVDLIRDGAAFRLPAAVLIGAAFVSPGMQDETYQLVFAGFMLGVVTGAVQAWVTVSVDREPVRDGWWRIALAEVLLAAVLLIGLEMAVLNLAGWREPVALLVPALVACPAVYVAIDLVERTWHRPRTQAAATAGQDD